jgi:hypothetical protein
VTERIKALWKPVCAFHRVLNGWFGPGRDYSDLIVRGRCRGVSKVCYVSIPDGYTFLPAVEDCIIKAIYAVDAHAACSNADVHELYEHNCCACGKIGQGVPTSWKRDAAALFANTFKPKKPITVEQRDIDILSDEARNGEAQSETGRRLWTDDTPTDIRPRRRRANGRDWPETAEEYRTQLVSWHADTSRSMQTKRIRALQFLFCEVVPSDSQMREFFPEARRK